MLLETPVKAIPAGMAHLANRSINAAGKDIPIIDPRVH